MKNITKRDVKVFLLGMLVMLLISVAYDWDENARAFSNGYNGSQMKTN